MNLYEVEYTVIYERFLLEGTREFTVTRQSDVYAATPFDARERVWEREDSRYGIRLIEVQTNHIQRIA